MRIDVGDKATELLHKSEKDLVPVLPNSINQPELIDTVILKLNPAFSTLAKNGSAISVSKDYQKLVFGHMGRGTPRSENDPSFSHKMPIDIWIEQINSIQE